MRLRDLSPDEVSAWSDRRDSDRCPGCGGREECDTDCTEGLNPEPEDEPEEEDSPEFIRWAGRAPEFSFRDQVLLQARAMKLRIIQNITLAQRAGRTT